MAISPHDAFCFNSEELRILRAAELEIDKILRSGKRSVIFDHLSQKFTEAMRTEMASRYIAAGWEAKIKYDQDFGQGYGGYKLILTAPKTTKDKLSSKS